MTDLYGVTFLVSFVVIGALYYLGCVWKDFFSIRSKVIISAITVWAVFFVMMGADRIVYQTVISDTTLLRYKMGIEGSRDNEVYAKAFYQKPKEEQVKILRDIEQLNAEKANFGISHGYGFSAGSTWEEVQHIMNVGMYLDILKSLYFLPLILPTVLGGVVLFGYQFRASGVIEEYRMAKEKMAEVLSKTQGKERELKRIITNIAEENKTLSEVKAEIEQLPETRREVQRARSELAAIKAAFEKVLADKKAMEKDLEKIRKMAVEEAGKCKEEAARFRKLRAEVEQAKQELANANAEVESIKKSMAEKTDWSKYM